MKKVRKNTDDRGGGAGTESERSVSAGGCLHIRVMHVIRRRSRLAWRLLTCSLRQDRLREEVIQRGSGNRERGSVTPTLTPTHNSKHTG